jgi:Zn-dependent protease with chaperone function
MKISPRDYMHSEDLAAQENLKSIPLFPQCVKAFMQIMPERLFYGMNMAQKIRLGPKQLPHIYNLLPPICATLGINEPELYLEMGDMPNAYTHGDTRIFICVNSALIEAFEEDEVCAVIAHECGHIACQHVLYHTIAQMLVTYGPQIFGPLAMISLPVNAALMHWVRRSELSADRAAAVAMGGSHSVVETMIRLAGGPKSITQDVDVALYLEQAQAFDKLMESEWDQFLQGFLGSAQWQSHPFLSVRAREISKWCEGDQFQRILQGITLAATAPRCHACQEGVQEGWQFCRSCGAKIDPAIFAVQSPVASPVPSEEPVQ